MAFIVGELDVHCAFLLLDDHWGGEGVDFDSAFECFDAALIIVEGLVDAAADVVGGDFHIVAIHVEVNLDWWEGVFSGVVGGAGDSDFDTALIVKNVWGVGPVDSPGGAEVVGDVGEYVAEEL